MKKTTTRKLQIHRETLRDLESNQLHRAQGGAVAYSYSQCFTVCLTDCCP